ncbi:hypothetical protein [Desulfosarcina sp.]|uniref:hypothetical protein n=1 Tax=Desulfosarcina sp. TaxID=2027861 RepID=UPI003567693B
MKRSEIKKRLPGIDPAWISLLPVLDEFHEGVIITDTQRARVTSKEFSPRYRRGGVQNTSR